MVQVLTVFLSQLLRTPASVHSASGSPGICLSHPTVLPSALPSRHPSSKHLRAFPPSFRLLVCLPSPTPLSPYGSDSVHWTIHPSIPSSCCSAHIRLARHPSGCRIRRLTRCSPPPRSLESGPGAAPSSPRPARPSVPARGVGACTNPPPPRVGRAFVRRPRAVLRCGSRAGRAKGRAGAGRARGGAERPRRGGRGPG